MNHPDVWQGEDNFQVEGYKENKMKTKNEFPNDAKLIYFTTTSSVPLETYSSIVSLLNNLNATQVGDFRELTYLPGASWHIYLKFVMELTQSHFNMLPF